MPEDRRAARVLLVDGQHRVLLLHGGDPDEPDRGRWWITPGGGIEPGESSTQAAVRELAEETGLRMAVDELGGVIHQRVTEFRFAGRDYRQSEDYYLLRIHSHDVDADGPGAVADPGITGHRWWSLPALADTAEVVYPRELSEVLGRLLGPGSC